MARLKAFDEDRALDLAVDCFWSRGYEATSVRDLADLMGIGGASLYNTYGGKRALFVRSLERYANRSMRERIARLEANRQPKEAILAFLAEIIDRSVADPDRKGCLLVNSALDVAPHDAEIGKAVGDYLGEIRAFFRRNIEAAHKDGPGAGTDRRGGRVGPPAGRGAGDSACWREPARNGNCSKASPGRRSVCSICPRPGP